MVIVVPICSNILRAEHRTYQIVYLCCTVTNYDNPYNHIRALWHHRSCYARLHCYRRYPIGMVSSCCGHMGSNVGNMRRAPGHYLGLVFHFIGFYRHGLAMRCFASSDPYVLMHAHDFQTANSGFSMERAALEAYKGVCIVHFSLWCSVSHHKAEFRVPLIPATDTKL